MPFSNHETKDTSIWKQRYLIGTSIGVKPGWSQLVGKCLRNGSWKDPLRSINIVILNSSYKHENFNGYLKRTSLMVQWIKTCLPMQGTRVLFLVLEDSTCHRATKLVYHNYWACMLQLLKPMCSATKEATAMGSLCIATKSSPHSLQLEKTHSQQWRPSATKKINWKEKSV